MKIWPFKKKSPAAKINIAPVLGKINESAIRGDASAVLLAVVDIILANARFNAEDEEDAKALLDQFVSSIDPGVIDVRGKIPRPRDEGAEPGMDPEAARNALFERLAAVTGLSYEQVAEDWVRMCPEKRRLPRFPSAQSEDVAILGDGTLERGGHGKVTVAGTVSGGPQSMGQVPVAIAITKAEKLKLAEDHLKRARQLIREADAPKSLAKVLSAIKSVGGAIRHAHNREYRADELGETK